MLVGHSQALDSQSKRTCASRDWSRIVSVNTAKRIRQAAVHLDEPTLSSARRFQPKQVQRFQPKRANLRCNTHNLTSQIRFRLALTKPKRLLPASRQSARNTSRWWTKGVKATLKSQPSKKTSTRRPLWMHFGHSSTTNGSRSRTATTDGHVACSQAKVRDRLGGFPA